MRLAGRFPLRRSLPVMAARGRWLSSDAMPQTPRHQQRMPDEEFEFMKRVIGAPSPIGLEAAMTQGVLAPEFERFGARKLGWHEQRYATSPVFSDEGGYEALDSAATLATSTFPIGPEELIAKAKRVLAAEFGTKAGADPAALLSDDFQFVAPIVGPLSRAEFVRAFGSFKLKEAFPALRDKAWFAVDPLEPNRAWFFSRAEATHTGTLHFGGRAIAATHKVVRSPPQAQSLLFDREGKVYTLTVGYCMDKRIGNTEGLGGVFAYLKAVGQPLPVKEGQRLYTPSVRFEALERLGKCAEALGYDPATRKRL